MHLKIVDSEGINAFFGNTVQLYNSAGQLVASQILNAQSGMGINDSSSLISFYGTDASETYHAVLVRATNGVSSNVTWDGLEAGNGKEGYVLTAEAATGGHSGTIVGTGYNDTFVAEAGTYTYNGSGGWSTTSDHDTEQHRRYGRGGLHQRHHGSKRESGADDGAKHRLQHRDAGEY